MTAQTSAHTAGLPFRRRIHAACRQFITPSFLCLRVHSRWTMCLLSLHDIYSRMGDMELIPKGKQPKSA
jgi:hypothetical protein